MTLNGEPDQTHVPGSFVGRARELAELHAGLEGAVAGRGGSFLISGEPGIGKTRLAEEVAATARARGTRVLWGRCWEGGGAPAYWPWIQVIRGCLGAADLAERRSVLESEHASAVVETVGQLVPELYATAGRAGKPPVTSRLDPEQARFRLFDSVATLLKEFARRGPLVIVLDDLHEADLSSLTMLRFVAREITPSNVFIIGTYRELEVQRSSELSQHFADLSREARVLPLTGLSRAEVAQFYGFNAGQAPDDDLVSRLHAATAGNPLFVDGVVRIMIADRDAGLKAVSSNQFKIPNTLREGIHRRLASISAETRSLLDVAATIGNEFQAELCLGVANISREQLNSRLDEAVAAGIVARLDQGSCRFVHALIRAAVHEALDTNTRLRIHGMIAAALEEKHAGNLQGHLAELAHHFWEAGISEKAIKYSRRAAKAANAVFAYGVAAAHWRQALALTEGQNDARRADLLFGLGWVAAFHLDSAEGVANLEAALHLYRELQDAEKVAVANAMLGLAIAAHPEYSPGMNIPRALEHFRQALEWKGDWTDLGTLGWLHQGMAIALHQAVRIDEGLEAVKQARQAFERDSNPAWMVSTSVHAQLLTIKGRHREAAALFDEVGDIVQDVADPEVFRSSRWYAGWCQMLLRDPIEAKRLYTAGMDRPGLSPFQRERHFEFLALTELLMGDLSRAKTLAAEHRVNPTFRAAIAFREGNWETAIRIYQGVIEWTRRTGYRWDEANCLSILFDVIRVSGDLERATEVFRQALRSYDPGVLLFEMNTRPQGVLLALEAGRHDEAIEHLTVCRAILAQGEDWLGRAGLVARAEGALAAAEGRDFATHFEKAIAIFQRYCMPWEDADTLYQWGIALNGAGENSHANEKFDAAIEIYRRHGGGQRWIDRVEVARPAAARGSGEPALAAFAPAVFKREGDFWAITHEGKTSRLRNLKGLSYIAHLLAHPGIRLHVCDLVAMVEGGGVDVPTASLEQVRADGLEPERDLGDAGETLDAQAISAYRRRSRELREELAEAERNHDSGALDRAGRELEQLTGQLSAGVGRGGRARRTSSHVERARALVTKNIRAAVERIRDNDVKLGDHLAANIRTGAFCAYLPDLESSLFWRT